MSSSGNEGSILLEKKMVSGRIPRYVIQYMKDRKISVSQLLMKGFDVYRENDLNHAFERLSYHENRVLHWKGIVLHHESECNTKQRLCNTIKTAFKEQNRGSRNNRRQDKNWLAPKIKAFIEEGIPITVDELYDFCVKEG